MQGYRSALLWLYQEMGLVISSDILFWLNNFTSGYKKTIADKKSRGVMTFVIFTARALYVISDMSCHGVGMSVRRIRWSPVSSNVFASENHVIKLASCSDDHSNRVFSFYNIFNALTV